ncbi:MAG: hypothetical protein IKS55_07365, partial [Oscillospiraceae bacterium]|nr:hypothetical protein [Oscillospiraceae bacterium]
DTIHMNFRQPPVGASGFPFSGGFISRLWWSNFPSLAVYIPFWNGVNTPNQLIPFRGKRNSCPRRGDCCRELSYGENSKTKARRRNTGARDQFLFRAIAER